MVIEKEPRMKEVTAGDFARGAVILANADHRTVALSGDIGRAVDTFEPSCAADGTWHLGNFSLAAEGGRIARFTWDPGSGCPESSVLVVADTLD